MASISDSNLNKKFRDELAEITIHTATLIAELIVHFLSPFESNQETVWYLKSKIEEIKNHPSQKSIIADKFVSLIATAEVTISKMRIKDGMYASTNEEIDEMVTLFYDSVTHLENVLTFLSNNLELTETNRLEYERDLGFVLYRLELIRTKVRKQQNVYEMEMKKPMSELRENMNVLVERQKAGLSDGRSLAVLDNVSRSKMIKNFVILLARKIRHKVVNLVILLFSKMKKSLEFLLNKMMDWLVNIILRTRMMKKLVNLAQSKMKNKKK